MAEGEGCEDASEPQRARHATRDRRFQFAGRDSLEGAAKHFGLLRTGGDADRERAGQEPRKADKALSAEQLADEKVAGGVFAIKVDVAGLPEPSVTV